MVRIGWAPALKGASPSPDRARTANEGIPLQIVDRTTIVASAIGVPVHQKPHGIEAERLGEGLGHRGGGKRRAAPKEDVQKKRGQGHYKGRNPKAPSR